MRTRSAYGPLDIIPTEPAHVRLEDPNPIVTRAVQEFLDFVADAFFDASVLSHLLRTLVRMDFIDPTELISGFQRVDLIAATPLQLRRALDDIRRVRARLDGVEAEIARRLNDTSPTPERDIARSAQRSNRHGARVLARAAALTDTPSFGQALETGELSGDHVDVFTKVLGALEGDVKTGFTDAAPELIRTAASSGSTPEEFAATLHTAAERIAADGGMSRFERQRRATRLRTWTDRVSGMWRLSGTFDPETGARIHGRLEAAMAAMFATKTPSTTPTDSSEKQDHLRALALLALTAGPGVPNTNRAATPKPSRPDNTSTDNAGHTDRTDNPRHADTTNTTDSPGSTTDTTNEPRDNARHATDAPIDNGVPDQCAQPDEWDRFAQPLGANTKRFGRPEFTVVIDTTNLDPDGHPTVDWGIPITIPWKRIQDLSRNADIRPVIVRDGAVIDADGQLNLGRTTRLANRPQRRALRALYATCAGPGCNVSFNHTKPHHVHWWRHGGPTDFANLLPLCSQHHHAAHEGGWLLTLGLDRSLTIQTPDGQTMHTGPPRRQQEVA